MAEKKEKTLGEIVLDFQTRLQGVANDLALKLAAVVASSDKDVLNYLIKELPNSKRGINEEIKRIKKIVEAVEKIRAEKYSLASDISLECCSDVADATTNQVAKEITHELGKQAREEREKRFVKTLTKKQQKAIVDGQGIDGATIGEWFSKWQRSDLERITSVVQRASVEELTVAEITKLVRGTKENNYTDGILSTTQVSAVRLARTMINGVCNNARMETIKENADVIDGVQFVGTLDGKTCPHCASYDMHIWRGEDMSSARRPPLHPNCRCTLVPYIELKDDDGNIVDVDSTRPAANADFDALAKEAYNKKAKENDWSRRWDDLSSSTRLKYYYQAQKDYESRTGNPAYRQVDSDINFAEYFKAQPDEFKRQWLGTKRYQYYKKGALNTKYIFSPDVGYNIDSTNLSDNFVADSSEILDKVDELTFDENDPEFSRRIQVTREQENAAKKASIVIQSATDETIEKIITFLEGKYPKHAKEILKRSKRIAETRDSVIKEFIKMGKLRQKLETLRRTLILQPHREDVKTKLVDIQNKIGEISPTFKEHYEYSRMVEDSFTLSKKVRLEIAQIIFPDRGGKALISDSFVEKAQRILTGTNSDRIKSDIEYTCQLFNIIGRCYNIGGKVFVEPEIKTTNSTVNNGTYSDEPLPTITISKEVINSGSNSRFIKTFSHELGHWLDFRSDMSKKNAEYVVSQTNSVSLKSVGTIIKSKTVPKPGCKRVFSRPDLYGGTVYYKVGRVAKDVFSSEVLSTNIEIFSVNPLALLFQDCEAYDIMVKTFSSLQGGK